MISNEQLTAAFLSPAMKHYFAKKLAPLAPDEVDIRIEETLKFLNFATFCEGNIPVTQEIDEIWHYWILQTHEYERLCQKLQGARFIHHSSLDYGEYFDPEIKAQSLDLEHNVAVLRSYVQNYGPFTAERAKYWRIAVRLMEIKGWSVDELNHWLGAEPALPRITRADGSRIRIPTPFPRPRKAPRDGHGSSLTGAADQRLMESYVRKELAASDPFEQLSRVD